MLTLGVLYWWDDIIENQAFRSIPGDIIPTDGWHHLLGFQFDLPKDLEQVLLWPLEAKSVAALNKLQITTNNV